MNHMTPEEILDQMEELFPDAHCELNHRNAYELLVAVVLSAQTTDASVNRVTPALFARFPTPQDMAAADEEEIGSYIRSIGLYRSKARSLRALRASLCEQFDGVVPRTYKELMSLAGVLMFFPLLRAQDRQCRPQRLLRHPQLCGRHPCGARLQAAGISQAAG